LPYKGEQINQKYEIQITELAFGWGLGLMIGHCSQARKPHAEMISIVLTICMVGIKLADKWQLYIGAKDKQMKDWRII
jgi:hypothetical protein